MSKLNTEVERLRERWKIELKQAQDEVIANKPRLYKKPLARALVEFDYLLVEANKLAQIDNNIAEKEQYVALREFWNRLCTRMWDIWELDGGTFQDWGEELGLLIKVSYDPEKHGFIDDVEPGDVAFVNALHEGNDNDDENDPVHTISET